jgi:predicted PurR-regulated permease PerM
MTPERRNSTTVELSVRSIVRFIAIVVAALVSGWLLLRIGRIITWIVVSAFFAVVLTPPVHFLNTRLKIRRGLATALVFVGALAILGGLTYAFVRPIVQQTGPFIRGLPSQIEEAQKGQGPVGKLVKRYKVEDRVRSNLDKLNTYVNDLGRNALGVLTNVFNTLFAVVTVSVLTVLMVLQGPSLLTGGIGLLSPPNQERMTRIGKESAKAVTGYVAGNLLISLVAGLFTWTFLSIVGVPYAGVLGLWVAFADLIPLVGATMGAIPTIGIAFLHSTTAGVATLIFYFFYQQFENQVLQPMIMSRAVAIRPLVVLISVLTGVELFGILGALLAIPVAGIIKVIGTEVLRANRPDLIAAIEARKAAELEFHRSHPRWWKKIIPTKPAQVKQS